MIYINSTLRIRRLDPRCLQLEEFHKPVPKKPKTKDDLPKWYGCGYYGNLKEALIGALNKKLFDSTKTEMTIKEAIGAIEQAKQEILTEMTIKEAIGAIEQAKQEILTAINQIKGEKQV